MKGTDLSGLHNVISELITAENITLKSVLDKRVEVNIAFNRFKDAHYLYVAYLTDQVVIEHEQTTYDLRVSEHYDIVGNYLK